MLGVASCRLATGQAIAEMLPKPYPSTATPEPLPLELAPPVSETVVVPVLSHLADNPAEDSAEVDVDVTLAEEPKWYHPSYWLRPPGWDTAVELGLNGSSGTSDSLSIRSGGYIKRETKSRKIDFDIYQNRTKAAGVETQNNAQANFRHDWLFAESPWTLYFLSQLYYDEFQAFDLNLNVNGGVGYQIVDKELVELTGRFGTGTSREFGGVDDEWVAEAQFGLDYEQKFTETQKFTSSVDYFPEWHDFRRYRLLTDIGYEVELVVPSNVSLKIAATNRYDSDPDGTNPNNLNYSVLLLWKL